MKTIRESAFRKAAFILLLSLASAYLHPSMASGYTYHWGHPSPQGNIVYSIAFRDAMTGWAVTGCGYVMKTTDGGNSWGLVLEPDSLCRDLYDILYSTQGTLLLSGDDGTILRSDDDGESWATMAFPAAGRLYDLALIPGGGLSAAGQYGTVLVSFDDGLSWTDVGPGGNGYARQHLWKSATECYVVGLNMFYRTLDGGNSWDVVETPGAFGLNEIYFVNDNVGYAIEDFGVWKTTNGGDSWSFDNTFNEPLYRFRTEVMDETHWFAVTFGEGGELWETTDAGASWERRMDYNSVGFPCLARKGDRVLFGSDIGDIFYTDDGGSTISDAVENVAIFPYAPIITIGRRPDGTLFANNQPNTGTNNGTFFRSDDGGYSWYAPEQQPGLRWVYDIRFADDQHGVLGSYEDIRYTNDGGASWNASSLPANFRLVNFAIPSPGVYFAGTYNVSSAGGNLFRSDDHGASWTAVGGGLPVDNIWITSVEFPDAATGYIACRVNNVYKLYTTGDGGQTWTVINPSGITGFISDMVWLDESTGIAAVPNDTYGIYRTTDGGQSWTQVSQASARHLTMLTADHIAAVGDGDDFFQESTDGGLSWQPYSPPFSASQPGYPGYVESIQATEEGYILGGAGNRLMVAKRDVATGITEGNDDSRKPKVSLAICPNPVHDQAIVRFTLDSGSQVTLAVVTMSGQRVRTIMHNYLPAGTHEIAVRRDELRQVPGAGVYVVTLQTSDRMSAAKVLLVD